jgi:dCMP deaminase
MTPRLSWDSFFLGIARATAARSTCPRASVGCVLTRGNRQLSAGYNGSVRGAPHCVDVGCELIDGGCKRVVHSEANAIATAARHGVSVEGATAYVSLLPCHICFQLLANAGIARIVYAETYRDTWTLTAANNAGIIIDQGTL